MSLFKKAVKHESKLRLSIAGPSGSGKTYSALAIGTSLGDRVAVIDTEHGSAEKYADVFTFDVLNLDAPFHPDRFIEAIEAAAEGGYDVVVVDSLSHAWNGPGGLLEIVDQAAARMKTKNTFGAWKEATPIHNRMIETIIRTDIHIIATMRSKQEYALQEDSRGRKSVQKLGMAPIQRDGMEYEFDVFAEMTMDNKMIIQKTRCSALAGQVIDKPGVNVALALKMWLSGEKAEPEPDRAAKASTNGSSAKAKTNGKAKTKKQEQVDAQLAMMDETLRRELHAVGTELYVQEWDDKRHELVNAVTQGRTTSSKELTAVECRQLIDGMRRKLKAAQPA